MMSIETKMTHPLVPRLLPGNAMSSRLRLSRPRRAEPGRQCAREAEPHNEKENTSPSPWEGRALARGGPRREPRFIHSPPRKLVLVAMLSEAVLSEAVLVIDVSPGSWAQPNARQPDASAWRLTSR